MFSVGLPGLDIPGIFSLGPTFSINAEVSASAGAKFESKITLQDTLSGLDFNFPPGAAKSSLTKNQVGHSSKSLGCLLHCGKNTDLALILVGVQLSVDTTGTLAGDLKADLIPKSVKSHSRTAPFLTLPHHRVEFGINVLDGLVKSTVRGYPSVYTLIPVH